MKYKIITKPEATVDIGKPVMGGMSIEKAIEILELYIPDPDSVPILDSIDAIELGIEALKVVHDTRRLPGMAGWRVLPGETRDEET